MYDLGLLHVWGTCIYVENASSRIPNYLRRYTVKLYLQHQRTEPVYKNITYARID